MTRFMIADQAAADRLNTRLADTMFKDTENFVKVYNYGLINRKHPDIQAIVAEVVKSHRNVKATTTELVFVSQEEVALQELTSGLEVYGTAMVIANELKRLVNDDKLQLNDSFFLSTAFPGHICELNDSNEVVPVTEGRVFARKDAGELLANRFEPSFSAEELDEGINAYSVSDFVDFDFSFLVRMADEIPR